MAYGPYCSGTRSNSQLLRKGTFFLAESFPILWEHMMTLPEQALVKRQVQISDDTERMKIALKSLKQENSRLNDLIVLLSERVIRPFPRTSSAAATTRELRMRCKSPLRQHLILAMQGRGTMLTKRSTAPLRRAATPLTAHYLPIGVRYQADTLGPMRLQTAIQRRRGHLHLSQERSLVLHR
jgi:hypothetical protein